MATKETNQVAEVPFDSLSRWPKEAAAKRRAFLDIPATGAIKNHPKAVLDGFEAGFEHGYVEAIRDLQMHGFITITR